MTVSNEEIAKRLLEFTYSARKWFKSRIAAEENQEHFLFTEARMRILSIIQNNETLRMSELSERCHVSKGSLTITLGKLVDEGYVERINVSGDRRVVMVKLTEKGENYLTQMKEQAVMIISHAFEEVPSEKKEKLADLMDELIRLFN